MKDLIISFFGSVGGMAFFIWAYMVSLKIKYLMDMVIALKNKSDELEMLAYSNINKGKQIIQ